MKRCIFTFLLQQALNKQEIPLNKATAVIILIKLWLFEADPDYIVNLGIHCDGKILNLSILIFEKSLISSHF